LSKEYCMLVIRLRADDESVIRHLLEELFYLEKVANWIKVEVEKRWIVEDGRD